MHVKFNKENHLTFVSERSVSKPTVVLCSATQVTSHSELVPPNLVDDKKN